MQVDVDRLPAALERGVAPLYLLTGDEPLLLQEARDAIRAAALAAGVDERHWVPVERASDWERVAQASDSLGLFASRRFFDVRLEKGADAAAERALAALAERPSRDDVLVVSMPGMNKTARAKAWVTAFEREGVVVTIWPVRAAELPRWLETRARRLGVALERDAVAYLASQVEGNLLAAAQQLDLLRLLDPGPWTVDALARAIEDAARFEAFSLFDAACGGDATRAVAMLRGLREEGEAPLPIVMACAAQLRRLLALQERLAGGEPFQRAAGAAGVFGRDRQRAWQTACERVRAQSLMRLLPRLANADQEVKGLLRGDPWRSLQMFLLALAGRPPRTLLAPVRDYCKVVPVGMR